MVSRGEYKMLKCQNDEECQSRCLSGTHPEHEVELVLPRRPVAHRRHHPAEVFKVEVLEHPRDPRRERGYRQLWYGHELILADVPFVPLVECSEALVQALDLAAVELAAAMFLHLLDVVLRQVQARRRQSLRVGQGQGREVRGRWTRNRFSLP